MTLCVNRDGDDCVAAGLAPGGVGGAMPIAMRTNVCTASVFPRSLCWENSQDHHTSYECPLDHRLPIGLQHNSQRNAGQAPPLRGVGATHGSHSDTNTVTTTDNNNHRQEQHVLFSMLPLVGFSVLSPAMLGWLAAAAIPLVIHLWSRRRYREMSWAAMEYLMAALRSSRRRMRMEQWLLLAIRTLLVALIVVAVAEPFFERGGFAFVTGESTHRVLVIDGSFSMAYKATDRSRFDRAKELAARIVEESPQGDGFTLVLMSSPPRVIVSTPVFEPQGLLQELENLRLPHTTLDLSATLAKVEEVVYAARREHPRLVREEIYFLTDLGRVGWAPDATAAADCRTRALRLAETANLVVIDLGQPDAENMAVTELRAGQSFATPNRDVHFEAQVKNFGRQARNRQTLDLLVDGRRVKQQSIDLPAGGETKVSFAYRFETPGDHVLEARLSNDNLEIDNHRYLTMPVKQAIPVLCIDGRPSGKPLKGAAGLLALALAPQSDAAARTQVHPEVLPESALLESDLGRYPCVFLANVAQFTASEARVLDAYLKNGGSLVFFLGDQVMAESYNRQLGGQSPGHPRLLPARLGEVVTKNQFRLDPLDYAHPIVEDFRSQEKAGLLTTPVHKYFKLHVPKDSPAKVALRLGDGSPLIVEEPLHRGRVILVATSADASWTMMPLWPSYVPIVQELLAYAIGAQLEQRNLRVGDSLGGTIATPAGDAPLTLHLPDGRNEQLRLHSEGNYGTWTYFDTSTSGVYSAQFAPPLAQTEIYTVNVDTAESDLAQLGVDELSSDLWPAVRFVHQTDWEDLAAPPSAHASRRNRLPKGLLYGVLGLLLAETFVAWRFGHHTP
jgi:hypothetical protein